MKKYLLRCISIISITVLFIMNNSNLIYAYNILNDDDKILDVLIISSYNPKDKWEREIFKGLNKTLNELKPKNLDLNLKYEYLDIRDNYDEKYLNSFNDLINTKYKNADIDVVFTINDEAFEFAKSQILNPKSVIYHKQIIFSGLENEYAFTDEEKKYINGIPLGNKEPLLLNMILYFHPRVDTINIILDDHLYSEKIKERILDSKLLLMKNIKFNFIQSNYIEDIREQLKKVDGKNQANIISGTFICKNDSIDIDLKQIVQDIKDITKNPLYTNYFPYVFSGVIGGYVDIGEKQGEYGAKEIYNILNGNQVDENISERPSPEFIFDYKEIYNYDIDTLRIPKDRIILNKPIFGLLLPKYLKIIGYSLIILLIIIIFYGINRIIKEKQKSRKNKWLYETTKQREKLQNDFIVNMSHELRTPLNVILSTIKVIELRINKNNYDNDYLLDKLNQINKNSNRLLKLVNNLIDISKFELGNYDLMLENLNIVEIIEDIVLESVDYSNYKDIDLIFDTEEEEIITAIDEEKIERVILNILSNAIKFTNKGGNINVYIKRVKEEVVISVEDNGIGIPKDKIDEIFNRFYQVSDTLKKHEEGSGIGLCIVEEIINLHNGKINVYSEENKGTKFEVILPIHTVEKASKNLQLRDIQQVVKLEMSDVDTKEN